MADDDTNTGGGDGQQDPPANGAQGDGGKPVDHEAEAKKWRDLSRKHEASAKANADAAKRLAEIEAANKSQAEKDAEARSTAEKKAADAERELARMRVALRKGLTEVQARRLIGDDEEALEKDADELLASFKQESNGAKGSPNSRPKESLRSGTNTGRDPDPEMDPAKLAAAIPR